MEMINYGRYGQTGTPNLLLVKHFNYAVGEDGKIHCIKKLTNIAGYYTTFSVPIKCKTINCFYIIGLTNLNKKLYIYLYSNVAFSCESEVSNFLTIDSDSDNLSCHLLLLSSDEEINLLCFFKQYNSKK